jgi:exosome complex component CSL4
MSLPSLALPGQLLGPISKYAPGPGTHIFGSQIYASILGPVTSTPPSKRPATSSTLLAPSSNTLTNPSNLPTLSIARHASSAASGGNWAAGGAGTSVLPEVDAVVLAKVTRLGTRQATVEILVVGDNVCREGFQGLVRREDVRATEKDRVKIPESFCVGDVVRGVVVSGTTLVYV